MGEEKHEHVPEVLQTLLEHPTSSTDWTEEPSPLLCLLPICRVRLEAQLLATTPLRTEMISALPFSGFFHRGRTDVAGIG